jgi:hypothetical protein
LVFENNYLLKKIDFIYKNIKLYYYNFKMSNKNINKKFVSIDDAHSFEITINEESKDLAYFSIINITPEHYKTFLLLLKDGFEYMIKNNILIVKQIVSF